MNIKKQTLTSIAAGILLTTAAGSAQAKSTIGGIVFTNFYMGQNEDGSGDKVTNTNLEVANNSRFRIRWDNEDSVSMYIEMAIRDDDKDTLRHAYGKWDIDEKHQLLVGQTSTPFAPLDPNVGMVNNSGEGYGSVSPSRVSQIRYTYKFQNRQGAFAIALVDPNQGTKPKDANGNNISRESKTPRLDIGMAYNTFNWQIFPSAFVHHQSYADSENLTSYGLSLGAKTASGPFTFVAEFGAGQNWGNTKMSLGSSQAGKNAGAIFDANGDVIEDTDNIGYWVDFGYRFSTEQTKGSVQFIYGTLNSESDNVRERESRMFGISAPIDLPWIARGLRIRPELFRFEDEDKLTNVETKHTIFGVQLQYTF